MQRQEVTPLDGQPGVEFTTEHSSNDGKATVHHDALAFSDPMIAPSLPLAPPPGISDADYLPRRPSDDVTWQARASRWLRATLRPTDSQTDADWCITEHMEAMATGCHVIAVTGPKGGVGKTTVALTAGLVLAEAPLARPILVELNPDWGTIDVLLPDPNARTVQDLLHHLTAVDRAGIGLLQGFVTMWGRLPVLTAPRFPGDMVRLSPHDVARVLHVLAVHYNVIILDCGASFTGQLTQFVLQVADHLLVVTGPDRAALRKTLAVVDYLASNHYAHDYGPLLTSLTPDAAKVRTRVPTEVTLVVNGIGPTSVADPLDFARLDAALPELNAVIALPYSIALRHLFANGTLAFDTLPADYRRALKSLLVATLGRLAHP